MRDRLTQMLAERNREINTSVNLSRRPELRWNYAIKQARERIEELQEAIRAFERYRDTGEPFLGKVPKGEKY